jgi:hypothetical protein
MLTGVWPGQYLPCFLIRPRPPRQRLTIPGEGGQGRYILSGQYYNFTEGGTSFLGQTGGGDSAGVGFGAGGGGASTNSGSAAGGAGANGIVIVELYA